MTEKCHSSDLLHVSANNLSRIEEYEIKEETKTRRQKNSVVSEKDFKN